MTETSQQTIAAAAPTTAVAGPATAASDDALTRAGRTAVVLLPAVLTLYLAFNDGGFYANTVGIAAVITAQVLVVRAVLVSHPLAGWGSLAAVGLLALAGLAGLQLLSQQWTDSTARALDEYTKTLLYLLAFGLLASIPRRRGLATLLVQGLGAAMATVCLVALSSRIRPEWISVPPEAFQGRLNHPLTYWNALGLMAAMTLIFALHVTCSLSQPRFARVAAAALMPAVGTTLVFTLSRGSFIAGGIGLLAYLVFGRPRGMVTGLIATAAPVAIAMRSAYDADLLASDRLLEAAAVAQGEDVAIVVAVTCAAAAIVRTALLSVDSRLRRPRVSVLDRIGVSPRVAGLGAAAVLVVAAFAIGAPHFVADKVDDFVAKNDAPVGDNSRERLTQINNNGRLQQWRVAADAFAGERLRGQGAGEFQAAFAEGRTTDLVVSDAHSLYMETLAEYGLVGSALLLIVLVVIFSGLARGLRGAERTAYAALLSAALAWAVHAGVDWDWEMSSITLWVFAAGGLGAARAQPSDAGEVDGSRRALLAVGWLLVAVAPLLVALSFSRVGAASDALQQGDLARARVDALSAMTYMDARPEPYAIVGVADMRQGFGNAAVEAMRRAVEREPTNWEYRYHLALARATAGEDPRATLHEVRRMNPREVLIIDAQRTFAREARDAWPAVGLRLLYSSLDTGRMRIQTL